jgi:DNA-binding Xre family transcriptional regulator
MLKWNFKRMCKMRGIKKPYSFFINLGISHTIASHMATDKLNKILLRHLQDSCLKLNCTPNDLLDWVPDNKKQDTPDTALYALKKGDKADDAAELLSRLPASKLEELAKMLRENPDSSRSR